MTIKKILGEDGPQNSICNQGSCPAAIVADDGNAYVQGYNLNADENAALGQPAGESFVRIPMATLKKIAAQVIEA